MSESESDPGTSDVVGSLCSSFGCSVRIMTGLSSASGRFPPTIVVVVVVAAGCAATVAVDVAVAAAAAAVVDVVASFLPALTGGVCAVLSAAVVEVWVEDVAVVAAVEEVSVLVVVAVAVVRDG